MSKRSAVVVSIFLFFVAAATALIIWHPHWDINPLLIDFNIAYPDTVSTPTSFEQFDRLKSSGFTVEFCEKEQREKAAEPQVSIGSEVLGIKSVPSLSPECQAVLLGTATKQVVVYRRFWLAVCCALLALAVLVIIGTGLTVWQAVSFRQIQKAAKRRKRIKVKYDLLDKVTAWLVRPFGRLRYHKTGFRYKL